MRQIVLRLAEMFGETVSAPVYCAMSGDVSVAYSFSPVADDCCLLQLLSDEQLGIQPDRQSLSNVSLDGSSSSRFSSA